MRVKLIGLGLVALSLMLVVPAAGATGPAPATKTPVGVGTLVKECYDTVGKKLNTTEYIACRALQAVASSLAAVCRTPTRPLPNPALVDDCSLLDGRLISEQQVAKFRTSWVFHALQLQRRLAWNAPLYEQQIPGTHNSFNASSYDVPLTGKPVDYFPTLTNQDPNQVYSITDQLQMGIRGLEIDLHWVPSVYGNLSTGLYWVDVCHGQSTAIPATKLTVHVGCTIDRSLQNTLAEIRAWLHAHPHQFLLVYLENQLDGKLKAHDIAAMLLRKRLGHLIYRPPAGLAPNHCASMPYAKSEAQMSRTGARVLLVGNCGPGNWNKLVFTRGPKWNEGGNPTYYGAAQCAADRTAREAHAVFRRWYEESPLLEALMDATQVLSARTTRRIVTCGVNLTGWDQLIPNDGRLRAFVWSWAKGQPATHGHCAFSGVDGRIHASGCEVRRHAACVDRHLDWHVTTARGPARAGARLCRAQFRHSRFGVPPNGLRNAQLRHAKPRPRDTVWLNYAKVHGRWQPDPAKWRG
jgi:hypothetical protein